MAVRIGGGWRGVFVLCVFTHLAKQCSRQRKAGEAPGARGLGGKDRGVSGAGPGWSLFRSRETLPASHMGQTDRRGQVRLRASTRPPGSKGGRVSGCSGRAYSWHLLCTDHVASPESQAAVLTPL